MAAVESSGVWFLILYIPRSGSYVLIRHDHDLSMETI